MEKSTMSVQELSAQMGISLPKAYDLVKTEGFPVLRIGTRMTPLFSPCGTAEKYE